MMKVYLSRKRNLMGQLTPIVIETNLDWALPYWTKRKKTNSKIFWEIV
jgi:hypothetical protein